MRSMSVARALLGDLVRVHRAAPRRPRSGSPCRSPPRARRGPEPSSVSFAATRGLTRIRNASGSGFCATSSRSLRITSIATVSSERITPSPSQVGHVFVRISRTPSVTFWRVISTRPSGEISTTYVFVLSSSSASRIVFRTWSRLRARAMSMKSTTMMPPMSRRRSWRTTSSAASMFTLVIVSSRRALAAPGEAARVDVDDGQRLGVVDHEVAARGQVHPARERRAHGLLGAFALEERLGAVVRLDLVDELRRGALEEARHPLVLLLVVDDRLVELGRQDVAKDANREVGLLEDQVRALHLLAAALDDLGQLVEIGEVALEVLLLRALGGGAHDDAALVLVDLVEQLSLAVALVVGKPAARADARALRHVDEVAARRSRAASKGGRPSSSAGP